MKTIIYSARKFEREFIINANADKHELEFVELSLNQHTVHFAAGAQAISIFVNDDASEKVLEELNKVGIKFITLRSAGYNHVDLKKAKQLGIKVTRVPSYSPYAVAEHTIALMLTLNRKLIRANSRVHDLNFSLEGLTGFDMNGKTVGIIGTGQIGALVAKILNGFGCKILAVDTFEDVTLTEKYGLTYTDLNTLYEEADIITLHSPLTPETFHIINEESINRMKRDVMLINTSRGALVNTKDVIVGLKSGQIGYLGLDVYEEESGLFFTDHSEDILQDDIIARLLTFPNVLITSHQAFLTDTALKNIALTTIHNLNCFEQQINCENEICI